MYHRRTDVDGQSAGDDGHRDLDQAVGNDAGQRDRPRRLRGGETNEKPRQKREKEAAEAGRDERQRRNQQDGQQVVADDRERLVELRAVAGRCDERRQRRPDDRRGYRAGDAREITRGGSGRKPESGDEKRGAAQPQQPEDARPALEARAQRAGGSLHRPAQPGVARKQRLARETVEAHAQEDRGERQHQPGESPQELGASEQDQRRLRLQRHRHGQDDERGHHVGRAHRSRVQADDHRAGDHGRDLADGREGQRDQHLEREVAEAGKHGEAVDRKPAVTQREGDRQDRRDLARVDLGLLQRRGDEHLERRAFALAHE